MIAKYFASFFRTLYARNQVNFLAFLAGICVMVTFNSPRALAQIQFEETTAMSGMIHNGMSYGASWGNVNADGWPDLWVSNHYQTPSLYINNGDGTFINSAPSLSDLNFRADAHGAAWGDFDNDGDQDLLQMVGAAGGLGSGPNQLLVNIDGTFQEMASDYGLAYPLGRGRMPLWLDWNRDGYLDVFMSNIRRADGQAPSALFTQEDNSFRNDNELVGLSFETNGWAQFADISGNGNWALILQGHPYPARVYTYNTTPFEDIRDTIGLESTSLVRGSIVADFNGDLLPDLYLSRSTINSEYAQTEPSTVKVFIKTNWDEQGIRFHATGEVRFEIKPEGKVNPTEIFIGSEGGNPERHEFTLSTTDPTVFGIPEHEPGTDCCVFIGYDPAEQEWTILVGKDGIFALNLLVEAAAGISNIGAINFESQNGSLPNKLYIQTDGGFVDVTSEAGLGAPSGSGSVVAADFDNDMDIDLYIVNRTNVVNQANLLYENLGEGLFAAVSEAGVIAGSTEGKGNSVATADYDRDGFIDLFIANGEGDVPFNVGPHQLFRNLGGDNHWIEIDLEGIVSNRDGVGTYLLATAGGVTQLRQQSGGVNRFSQNHQRIHFGLGPNTAVDRLVIHWPSGREQRVVNIPADQIIRITEPGPAFAPGKPVYIPGQDAGVYLWKESFDSPYQLRVSGDGPRALFDTTILAERAFEAVVPLQLEANDIITHQENTLSLTSWVTTGEDGVDFILPPGTAALIAVEQDGVPNPRQLHTGPSGDPLAPAGFVINANELRALPAFEGGQDLGLFIGHGGVGNVIARWNGDGFAHRTTLKLLSSNALLDVKPVRLELHDTLTEGPFHLQVSGWIGTWWDGVDVSITPDSTLGIYYEQDGLFQSHRVNPLTRDLGFPNAYTLPIADVGGEPAYEPATEKGLYIWLDEDDTWHLRVTAGGDFGRYSGAIVASAPYSGVTGVALEAHDLLDVSDPRKILFDFSVGSQWTDGIDFAFPEDTDITLELNDDTATAAELVNIGGERWPVNQLPVQLQ